MLHANSNKRRFILRQRSTRLHSNKPASRAAFDSSRHAIFLARSSYPARFSMVSDRLIRLPERGGNILSRRGGENYRRVALPGKANYLFVLPEFTNIFYATFRYRARADYRRCNGHILIPSGKSMAYDVRG